MRGWLRKGQGIRQRLLRIWHCVKIYQRNFERDLNSISYGLTFVSLFELEILLAIELHSPWKINFQLGNLFCLYFIFVDITKPRERRESWAISEIAKVALLSEKAMSIHTKWTSLEFLGAKKQFLKNFCTQILNLVKIRRRIFNLIRSIGGYVEHYRSKKTGQQLDLGTFSNTEF